MVGEDAGLGTRDVRRGTWDAGRGTLGPTTQYSAKVFRDEVVDGGLIGGEMLRTYRYRTEYCVPCTEYGVTGVRYLTVANDVE